MPRFVQVRGIGTQWVLVKQLEQGPRGKTNYAALLEIQMLLSDYIEVEVVPWVVVDDELVLYIEVQRCT